MDIHVLDMGEPRYGDSLVVRHNGRVMLIDGGNTERTDSIAAQLVALLGPPPHRIDLLVVTHCHADHIGCLPGLVANGSIEITDALVADERLGFGYGLRTHRSYLRGRTQQEKALLAALQEEDYSDLPDEELAQVLRELRGVEDRYRDMLRTLEDSGTNVVRYNLESSAAQQQVKRLEEQFADCGLKVLGPTRDQLVVCARAIESGLRELSELLSSSTERVASARDSLYMYRRIAGCLFDETSFVDSYGSEVSPAKNDQSIIIKVAAGHLSALLPGDMQFADAGVSGVEELMVQLRTRVREAGPYSFVKLPHHTANNGIDASVLSEWRTSTKFAHSGGSNDPAHPGDQAMDELQGIATIEFARTDRNGSVTVQELAGDILISADDGSALNDFSPNQ
jgi:beta-lactamase superfamily II metal-dependent hydrolase